MRIPVFILVALLPVVLSAQADIHTENAVSGLLDNESSSSSLDLIGEEFELLRLQPLNLNTAGEDELSASGLFTPFQLYSLLEYRKQCGPFFTANELAALPGFRQEKVQELLPFLSTESSARQSPLRSVSRQVQELVVTGELKQPLPAGFMIPGEDSLPVFKGTPFKLSLRYKASYGKNLSWGISGEKDAGELLLRDHQPQFITGYLRYSGKGFLREALAGSYRIRTGLGLANGIATGQGSMFSINNFRAGEIKPYASLNESNFSSGLALRAAAGNWEILSWATARRRDISMASSEWKLAEPDIFRALNETGLHRTPSEEKGRGLALLQTAGLQLNRRSPHLTTGLCLQSANASLNECSDSLAGIPDTLSTSYTTLSFFSLWFTNRLTLFTEYACTPASGMAVLGGLQLQAGSHLQLSLVGRAYSGDYRAPEAEAFSLGGLVSNEKGLYAGLQLYPLKYTTLIFIRDFAYYPAARYLCELPSEGSRTMAQLSFEPPGKVALQFRYQERLRELTPANGLPGIDPPEHQKKKSFRADGKVQLTDYLTCNFRTELSALRQGQDSSFSVLVYQQVSYDGPAGFRFQVRQTLFRADNWDNRIYCYEPGVRYSFSFPVYYGRGSRTTFLVKMKTGKRSTIYIRLSRLNYTDKLESGSGNDLVHGDIRWEGNLQLILKI